MLPPATNLDLSFSNLPLASYFAFTDVFFPGYFGSFRHFARKWPKKNELSRVFSETFLQVGYFRLFSELTSGIFGLKSILHRIMNYYGCLHPNKVIAMAIVRCQLGKNYLESQNVNLTREIRNQSQMNLK